MSKSDIEIDDAERGSNDSETKDREFDNKEPDTNIKGEGGKLPCVAAVSDDANRTESGVEDVNQSINEGKDIDKDNIEVQEQTNPESEGNEPVDGSNQENTNIVGENEKRIDTKMGDEGVADLRSAVEGQMDIKNEVLQQNITCGGENGQKSTENGLDGENHEIIVEEKSKEKVAEKESEELVMGDADHIENVEGDKTSSDGGVGHGENDEGDNQKMKMEDTWNDPSQNTQLPTELSTNKAPQTENVEMGEAPQTQNVEMGEASQTQTVEMGEAPQTQIVEMGEAPQSEVDEMKDSTNMDGDKPIADNAKEEDGNTVKDGQEEQGVRAVLATPETNENVNTVESTAKCEEDSSFANEQEPSTPNSLIRDSLSKAGDHNEGTAKSILTPSALPLMGENDDGTPEEQAAFMKEIESFYRKKAVDFKPPKFYGQPLNCLKLWRAVIRLGGYDRVTGSKLWRQVGESFHPPKTCTTVSWTFRIFYEKSLLEYERHKTQSGEVQLPMSAFPEVSGVDVEGNGFQGSGRARRDAAARAMQGWHAQRLSDYGEVGEPIIKDKNLNNVTKREKNLKSIGSLKQKRPSEAEQSNKAPRTEASKQLATSVVDVGPPADWVKINVRQTKDCFEIYALVPGLLREEVRVQTDPAGRVVITGQPEQLDNPWGITPFKKVVSLPSRIDPLQTSAVVSLHGRLFVRVPFEQLNA